MRTHTYVERDYAFGQVMLTLRTAIRMTQIELAQRLGISRGAVLGWEAGRSYPKADRLKRFIALGVKLRAFPAAREEEEIRALWQAAHQKVLLDEPWLSALLGERPPPLLHGAPGPGEEASASAKPVARPAPGRRVDWDDALAMPNFYGRKAELATLEQWVVQERCRLVSVLGMGGIGKSALAVTLMYQVAERFEVVLFRSLRDTPSCEELLDDCLQVLSAQTLREVPASLHGCLKLLLARLRERRVLLVLDNLEVLLQDSDHPDITFCGVAWSPDGRWLASGSYLHGVQVWDVTSSTPRWVSRTHPTVIRRVARSPDGTRLASGGEDGSLYVWEASDGTLLQTLEGHRGMVASVVWSPDGSRLASCGGGSGELFIWDAHRGERLRTFANAQGRVLAVDWSPRGELLVSGDSDGMLRWWDVPRGECVRAREAQQGAIQALRISPDGRRLASCGDDGAVKVWDLESGELLRRDRPYERLTITGVQGLSEAQKATLRALGAIEDGALPF